MRTGTLIAAVLAVCVAQMALAIPAVLNGLFQQDLATSSAQLTWISDAFLVPVCVLELTFGVLGDLFGRKRLLVGGALLLAAGMAVGVSTPMGGSRLTVLWTGQIIAGLGAAAIFPTSLAMIAGGTYSAGARARSVAIWAAALSFGNCLSPLLGGLAARFRFGSDPLAGWKWAYLVVLALALISALVSVAVAQGSSSPEGRSLDWAGQATIAIALFALLYAFVQGPSSGWRSPPVLGGFLIFALFLTLFIVVERRSEAPLLRLDFFYNTNFAVASAVTIIGMFAFLGTAYSTSIRLSAIQGFSPLKTSVAFLFLNATAVVQLPLTIRLLKRHNPKWPLVTGLVLMACGALWLAAIPAAELSLLPVIAPFILVGSGFALSLSSLTLIAVNAAPNHLAGMTSGTTNMLRDFGFTLGPAIIGAVALSQAAAGIRQQMTAHPALSDAYSAFLASPAHVPAAERPAVEGAVHAVTSGPLGANAVPATVTAPDGTVVPFNPLKHVAFNALSHSYSIGFLLCGAAALLAAVLAAGGLRPSVDEDLPDLEELLGE